MIELNSIKTAASIDTTKSLMLQNESSNSSCSCNQNDNQNDSVSSINTSLRSNENECENGSKAIECNQYLTENINNSNNKRKLSTESNDGFSAFIKRYYTNQLQNSGDIENENKKPKKSFFISDILGLNYNKDVSTPATTTPSTPIQPPAQNIPKQFQTAAAVAAAAAASNFLINLSYSNLVSNLNLISANNKRFINEVEADNDENNLKSNDNKKFKINDEEKSEEKPQHQQHKQKQEKSDAKQQPQQSAQQPASSSSSSSSNAKKPATPNLWPAWVYCTRYSDRPSAGPRHKRKKSTTTTTTTTSSAIKTKSVTNKVNIADSVVSKTLNTFSSSTSTSSLSSNSSTQEQIESTTKKRKFNEDDHENNSISIDDDELNSDYDDDDDSDSVKSNSKRPRTAFTSSQLNRLKDEFNKCKYLTGEKRQYLANELNLNESQIKIWFQNKRAKIKKSSGVKNTLALQLMAQGLYNHGSHKN